MTTIQLPQLKGMDESHRRAIVSAFQSAQQAIDSVQKSIVPSSGNSSQQISALTQRVAQLAAAITALTNRVNNLPSGGSSAAYPVVGSFKMLPAISVFPVAVYESAPGVVKVSDSGALDTVSPVIGIATAASGSGNCNVTVLGEVTSSTWAWTPDEPIFIGAAGALTQNPMSTAGIKFLAVIGFAVSATTIFVMPSQPIMLNGGSQQVVSVNQNGSFGLTTLPPVPVFFPDGDFEDSGMPIPGNPGPTGQRGIQGFPGPVVYLDPDQGEDGMPIPGSRGVAGANGAAGAVIFIEPDQGEEGMPIPGGQGMPGVSGASGGLQILALASIRPGSDTTYATTTSTTPVAVDAVNLSLTFIVPASGKVNVSLEGLVAPSNTTAHNSYYCLLDGTNTIIANTKQYLSNLPNSNNARIRVDVFVSGLTPGATLTYRWGWLSDNASSTVSLFAGPNFGSLDMQVVAIAATGSNATTKTIVVPISGFSNTIPSAVTPFINYILKPAGTLATGTITMPATPIDGQIAAISSTQIVTILMLNANAGQLISNAVTTLNPGPSGTVRYIYDLSSTTWYPA